MQFIFPTALILSVLWGWAIPEWVGAAHNFTTQVRDRIERQVKAEIRQKGFTCQGEIICGLQVIPTFYQGRDFSPVWFDANGLRPTVQVLIKTIRTAHLDGLKPNDYHLEAIDRILGNLKGGRLPIRGDQVHQWADLDLILTDAFLLLGSHLSAGRINPENIHADWVIGPRSLDMLAVLNATVTQAQMHNVLDRLRPVHEGYVNLKSALQQMRTLAYKGGWPQPVQKTPTLRPSESDQGVATIRRLLKITGDYTMGPPVEQPQRYDDLLVAAVRRFQLRHGLEPDGVIGRKSREAMNVRVEERIRQIELNLERWRWLPRDLGDRYLFVNTAAFYLQVLENSRIELDMKVVVGRPARQSPVFSSIMTYMVLNPYWNVPHTIAVEDILPKLTQGVDYLIDQSFKVFSGWGEDDQELAPEQINWERYSKHYFPLRLRQEPGKKNALGQIKFMFPNKFAVYLHDTPQKSLFNNVQRGFSSGCIRVEDARALAKYLLAQSPEWTEQTLTANLETGRRQVVRIPEPINIHLLYMTAWVDENGLLQFRNDIYQRDAMLDKALVTRSPYPLPYLAADAGSTTLLKTPGFNDQNIEGAK
ncbi:MAG: L,D-transpeptidase family protein [Desulfobacteraceae bacterium]